MSIEGGETDAEVDGDVAETAGVKGAVEVGSNRVMEFGIALPAGIEKDGDELVAAATGHAVPWPGALAERGGNVFENHVSGGVSMAVVDVLEGVDIDDGDVETGAGGCG